MAKQLEYGVAVPIVAELSLDGAFLGEVEGYAVSAVDGPEFYCVAIAHHWCARPDGPVEEVLLAAERGKFADPKTDAIAALWRVGESEETQRELEDAWAAAHPKIERRPFTCPRDPEEDKSWLSR